MVFSFREVLNINRSQLKCADYAPFAVLEESIMTGRNFPCLESPLVRTFKKRCMEHFAGYTPITIDVN